MIGLETELFSDSGIIKTVRHLIKMFVVWLIAVMLPLQGFAAVAMMHCQQLQPAHSVQNDHHTHDAETANHVHSHSDNTQHVCNHCDKCSACCSGFTLATASADVTPDLSLLMTLVGFVFPIFTSHISSGPERPPRTTLV